MAVIGIPLAVLCALGGGLWLWAFVVVLQVAALWEWRALTAQDAARFDMWATSALAIALDVMLHRQFDSAGTALFLCSLVGLLAREALRKHHRPLVTLSASLLFVLYVALPFALWTQMDLPAAAERSRPVGALLLLWIATWVCDSTAYYGGSYLGKRPLYPAASPKKTVEGFLFGAAGAFLAAPALSLFVELQLTLSDYIALGLAVGLMGQIGDLLESLIKRQAGVKDSSALLPGHGGVLDRFDSLLLSTPAFFSYLLVTSN